MSGFYHVSFSDRISRVINSSKCDKKSKLLEEILDKDTFHESFNAAVEKLPEIVHHQFFLSRLKYYFPEEIFCYSFPKSAIFLAGSLLEKCGIMVEEMTTHSLARVLVLLCKSYFSKYKCQQSSISVRDKLLEYLRGKKTLKELEKEDVLINDQNISSSLELFKNSKELHHKEIFRTFNTSLKILEYPKCSAHQCNLFEKPMMPKSFFSDYSRLRTFKTRSRKISSENVKRALEPLRHHDKSKYDIFTEGNSEDIVKRLKNTQENLENKKRKICLFFITENENYCHKKRKDSFSLSEILPEKTVTALFIVEKDKIIAPCYLGREHERKILNLCQTWTPVYHLPEFFLQFFNGKRYFCPQIELETEWLLTIKNMLFFLNLDRKKYVGILLKKETSKSISTENYWFIPSPELCVFFQNHIYLQFLKNVVSVKYQHFQHFFVRNKGIFAYVFLEIQPKFHTLSYKKSTVFLMDKEKDSNEWQERIIKSKIKSQKQTPAEIKKMRHHLAQLVEDWHRHFEEVVCWEEQHKGNTPQFSLPAQWWMTSGKSTQKDFLLTQTRLWREFNALTAFPVETTLPTHSLR